jgi:hypothetical protein
LHRAKTQRRKENQKQYSLRYRAKKPLKHEWVLLLELSREAGTLLLAAVCSARSVRVRILKWF